MDGNRLVARDLADGAEVWRVSAIGHARSRPPAKICCSSSNRARSSRLREADGSVAWERSFPETLAAPLVWDNGWLIAATTSGTVLAFRAADGDLIWRRDLGVAASARPALAADRVYVPAANGRVIAMQRREREAVVGAPAGRQARSGARARGSPVRGSRRQLPLLHHGRQRSRRLALADRRRRHRASCRRRAARVFRFARQYSARTGSTNREPALETNPSPQAPVRSGESRRHADRQRHCADAARVSHEGRRARPARWRPTANWPRRPTRCRRRRRRLCSWSRGISRRGRCWRPSAA